MIYSEPFLCHERKRYAQFKDQVYESLKSIKEKFHFHLIDAVGSPDDGTEVLLLPLCSTL